MAKAKDNNEVQVTTLSDVTYLSTGIGEMDELLGGGWARGRMTQLWGNPGAGKSYLLSKTMEALTDDQKALYIDAEFALVKSRLEQFNVDLDKITIVQDGRLEYVTEYILEQVGNYDLIVIDSLAKLVPMTVEDNEVGTNAIGQFARLVKHFEAKLKPRLSRSQTAFVVINQVRAGMGLYSPSKPQGGFAWEHGIDIQVKLTKGLALEKQVEGKKHRIGHWVDAEVQKSRLTKPYIKTKFKLEY